jgi:UDP-N-acetylglucosamine 1-carboxyvinyltransferase
MENGLNSESSSNSGNGQRIVIRGGKRLTGTVPIGGSKNAAVALIAGALLAESGDTVLTNVPRISDIETLAELLCRLGATVGFEGDGHTIRINAAGLKESVAPVDLVARMRASFWVLGPVLARLGRAVIPQPGGCNIGARAVDLHLKGMEALGASVESEHGAICADAPTGGLRGANIYLDLPSVGATMNVMMAATLAEGVTVIQNAAQEPDVENLGDLLAAMGADISGQGTGTILIRGVKALRGANFAVMPDRIEAGTFAAAAAITGGDVVLQTRTRRTSAPYSSNSPKWASVSRRSRTASASVARKSGGSNTHV